MLRKPNGRIDLFIYEALKNSEGILKSGYGTYLTNKNTYVKRKNLPKGKRMNNTFLEFKKNLLSEESEVSNKINPTAVVFFNQFAKQFSGAFQSSLENALERVEVELNEHGYTLGEIDYSIPFDLEGEEDFAIMGFATGDILEGAYINFKWTQISGKIYDMRTDGSKLRYDIEVKIIPTDEGIEALLREAAIIPRKTGKKLLLKSGDQELVLEIKGNDVSLAVKDSAGKEAVFKVAKNKSSDVFTKLMDHYIDNVGTLMEAKKEERWYGYNRNFTLLGVYRSEKEAKADVNFYKRETGDSKAYYTDEAENPGDEKEPFNKK